MKHPCVILSVALIAVLTTAFVIYNAQWVARTQTQAQHKVKLEAVKLTAEFDHDRYFLGENVLVHFTLENRGTSPLELDSGGDYRGAPRSLRFKVIAIGPDGSICPDPFPDARSEGGLGGSGLLKQGQKFYSSLPLMRYCQINAPGKYRISVSHDFGWNIPTDRLPVATAEVTFVMPTKAEARKVVENMSKLQLHPITISGSRSGDYQDFSALQSPIYLPFLEALAEKEATARPDEEEEDTTSKQAEYSALTGIASIAAPEATAISKPLKNLHVSSMILDRPTRLCLCLNLSWRIKEPQDR